MVARAENTTTSDLELAQRASQGNRVAALTLARRLMPRVRTTVHYLVADDRDADDLVQMCLVEVLRVIGKYSGKGALERWVDRVVTRYALRQITRRRWREGIVTLDPEQPGSAPPTQQADAERQQLRQRMAALLSHLPPDRRTVVVLHWVRGYTIAEIAEMTDTKVNTVRGRLRTAKRQILELIPDDPVLREWAESRQVSND